ncbi:MAG: VOC family protein [Alphaproteobacteria bacterium]|nr:VOC family protein [Alphaproteobacteria bacterium]
MDLAAVPGLDLTFHHQGLALKRGDKGALTFLSALGYTHGDEVYDPLQDVRVRMCTHATLPDVEIVQPGERPGPLDRWLKHNDEIVYHLCYETSDREAALAALDAVGLRVFELVAPVPAVLFGGRRISFHRVYGFGVVELLDRG